MHRLDSARCLDTKSSRPADFDIDKFILREFGIRLDPEPLQLVLRIRGVLAKYLAETPISSHQTLTQLEGEWTQVRVEVLDTIQLRTWLRSLGPDAVVDEPLQLRDRMRADWAELQSLYMQSH